MRIKNMPRFIVAMSIIFIIIFFVTSLVSTTVFSHEEQKYEEVVVACGDTLWGIAKNYDGNINENIYNIKTANNLENSEIFVGQMLKIPVR